MLTNLQECKLRFFLKTKQKEVVFYRVLIGVFNFLGFTSTLMQAFIHSHLPFLIFFGHVIHFYKFVWVDLMETYLGLLQTLSF